MCVKLHKPFRLFACFSTERPEHSSASFFSIEKKSFKINALTWSQSACSQSYPHFMCGTAFTLKNCRVEVKSDAENPAFQAVLHFYAWQ
jgi:hypothetical protein